MKNTLEKKIDNEVNAIVKEHILSCENCLFSEVNRIVYEVDTSLSQLLYENFENLYIDNTLKIEELEDRIADIEDESDSEEVEELEEQIEELKKEEEEVQEILEFWKISEWLYYKLREQGEPVLDSDFGYYWGRTCSGQSITMDYCIRKIVEELV